LHGLPLQAGPVMLACPAKVLLTVVWLFTAYVHVKVRDVLTFAPKPLRKLVPVNEFSTPNVWEKLVWLCCP
jgi:hypothetical protein